MSKLHHRARTPSLSPSPPAPLSQKRRHVSGTSLPPTQVSPKNQKPHHFTFPPQFWDGLSTMALTSNAITELHRRNTELQRVVGQAIGNEDNHLQPPDQFLRGCSSQCLYRLKQFAAHGGPDLRHLRGYQVSHITNHAMEQPAPSSLGRRKRGSQSAETSSRVTTSTRNTTPYDRNFYQHLIDHGILPDNYEYPGGQVRPDPENMNEILEALAQRRPSLSPSRFSHEDFREFNRANNYGFKENLVMKNVIPILEGGSEVPIYAAGDVSFSNLDPLTDGNLSASKPDHYYGAQPGQVDRRIREELSGLIVPSTQDNLPAAPNFFVEVMGLDGSAAVAKRQITYDMALGERGQAALLAYGGSESTHNEAHTLGATYLDGHLKLYATHTIPPSEPAGQPQYVLTNLRTVSLTDDPDGFRKGAAVYRNARDWAKRQRDQAIQRANERAKNGSRPVVLGKVSLAEMANLGSPATVAPVESKPLSFDGSETSRDELSDGQGPPNKRRKGLGKKATTRAPRQKEKT